MLFEELEKISGRLLLFLIGLSMVTLACSVLGGEPPTLVATAIPIETAVPDAEQLVTVTPSPPPTFLKPFFEETDCELSLPPQVAVTCGFVIVTEDRSGDPADTIRVAVAVYHSPDADETAVPTFYLTGGPGSPAVTWSDGFYEVFIQPLLVQGDVIFMDHRGSGLSEPSMQCEEIQAVYLADFKAEWDDLTRSANYGAAFLSCRTRLIREGINIKAYTTTEAAGDVRDVAAVFGYERVNLYGVSYGTRLGQAVMRDFSALVNSAVLDSVLPLEAKYYNDTTSRANYALETLFAGCSADPACSAAYPDLEAHFYSLVAQFDEKPVTVSIDDPTGDDQLTLTVGDSSLVNAMVWALHQPDYVAQTPKIVEDVYAGNYALLRPLKALPFSGIENINIGLRLSVECHDQVFPTTVEEMEADILAYPVLADFGYAAIYGGPEFMFRACQLWGAAGYDPDDNAPLQSTIPTLILAGQYDPTTPAYYGQQVADNLTNSYFFEFAGHGHAPSVGRAGNCALSVALEFLANPFAEPAPPCLLEPAKIPFFVPFDGSIQVNLERVENPIHNLSGLIPTGWVFIGNGFYNREQYAGDGVQIGFQASGVTVDEWLVFLEDNYQNVGLDTVPESAGTFETNGHRWRFYTAFYYSNQVDIALLEFPDGQSWLVMMQSNFAEREALFEAVFLPVIESVEWLE